MNATNQRNEIMKKTLIAAAALATIAAGMAATASTAEAKIHLHGNINIGLGGFGPAFYDPGYGYYDTGFYDASPDCGYVKVKKVMWINGHKYVTWKNKLICE
jgi:hypothetical protein